MWSLFWLRAATVLYSLGLLQTLLTLFKRGGRLFEPARTAFAIGAILHFVSLVEHGFAASSLYESLSLSACFLAVTYLLIAKWYHFPSLSFIAFPIVFLLAALAATETPTAGWADAGVRNAWLVAHVILVSCGYVAIVVTAAAAMAYLLQERHLKKKETGGLFRNLPPLGTLDNLTSQAMTAGFVLITLGFFTAWAWAFIESGSRWLSEAKVHISLLTWLFYLLVMYLRVVSGWRGRRAAFLAVYLLGFSVLTWVSHGGLRSLLER